MSLEKDDRPPNSDNSKATWQQHPLFYCPQPCHLSLSTFPILLSLHLHPTTNRISHTNTNGSPPPLPPPHHPQPPSPPPHPRRQPPHPAMLQPTHPQPLPPKPLPLPRHFQNPRPRHHHPIRHRQNPPNPKIALLALRRGRQFPLLPPRNNQLSRHARLFGAPGVSVHGLWRDGLDQFAESVYLRVGFGVWVWRDEGACVGECVYGGCGGGGVGVAG